VGKKTDRVISDHMVVDALIMGANAISNMSDEDIARDYARQGKITKARATELRKGALEMIRPVVEAIAQRGGIDFTMPEE